MGKFSFILIHRLQFKLLYCSCCHCLKVIIWFFYWSCASMFLDIQYRNELFIHALRNSLCLSHAFIILSKNICWVLAVCLVLDVLDTILDFAFRETVGRWYDVMNEQIMDLEIELLNPESLVTCCVIFEPCRPWKMSVAWDKNDRLWEEIIFHERHK